MVCMHSEDAYLPSNSARFTSSPLSDFWSSLIIWSVGAFSAGFIPFSDFLRALICAGDYTSH